MDYDDENDAGNDLELDEYGGEFGMGGNEGGEDPDDTDQQDEAALLT